MTRSDNLVIDEDEFQRTKLLVIGKAKRYNLKKVEVSDRLVTKFQPDQVERLVAEVAEAGFELTFKTHGYAQDISNLRQQQPRFGSEPRHDGVRHPKSPNWARELD